ncbi:MAG: hypothetical protein CMJ49_12730 [Planctomycetaceae bacterium]|nr:hypothetical protein [Planctomycetaceae bacterium]
MFEREAPSLSPDESRAIADVLGRIPRCHYIMTARTPDRLGGALVTWVQQAGAEPPMISVTLQKARSITPLILDAHAFCLCQIDPSDRTLIRRFSASGDAFRFDGLPLERGKTGAPIVTGAQAYLECEVIRHTDFDGDHDLYVAQIVAAGILRGGEVIPHFPPTPTKLPP